MIEKHPYSPFFPTGMKYLIIGSFPGKDSFDWYYGSKRNQFWKIIERIYKVELTNKNSRKILFKSLKIGIIDLISSCERIHENNLDSNLINISYNDKQIAHIFKKNKIEKVFFTSKYVEKKFKKLFKNFSDRNKNIELICLPSPSPRYTRITFEDKVRIYKSLLPKL